MKLLIVVLLSLGLHAHAESMCAGFFDPEFRDTGFTFNYEGTIYEALAMLHHDDMELDPDAQAIMDILESENQVIKIKSTIAAKAQDISLEQALLNSISPDTLNLRLDDQDVHLGDTIYLHFTEDGKNLFDQSPGVMGIFLGTQKELNEETNLIETFYAIRIDDEKIVFINKDFIEVSESKVEEKQDPRKLH